MICIYPKGGFFGVFFSPFFFFPYGFDPAQKITSSSFCVHWGFMWRDIPTWQKTFGHELLRDAEANKTKPNSMKSEKAMLGSNQTRYKQNPSHQLQPDQTRYLPCLRQTRPDVFELILELRGIERPLGIGIKRSSFLLSLTPGGALLCFPWEVGLLLRCRAL